MRFRNLSTGVLAAATLVVATAAFAGFQRQAVNGRLRPVAEDGAERGTFHLGWVRTDADRVRDRIDVACNHLDVTVPEGGSAPVYDLWLTTSDGATSVDFGDLTVTRRGRGGFHFNSRIDTFPDGVTSVSDFSGGTIEVRNGDTSVLSATIPTFAGPGDEPTQGAIGVRRDASRLTAADGLRAHGTVEARYANTGHGVNEQIWVRVDALDRAGNPYTVVALDGSGGETQLFELTVRGRFGAAVGTIDTRNGDALPGDLHTTDLSERDVEIRDKDGAVVLSGKFPTIVLE